MSSLAFFLILTSGLMHALWNLLVKRSSHKTVFIWWMFVASGSLFSLLIPFLPEPFLQPDRETLFLAVAGAVCFVLYHLLNGRAYQGGDLSMAYPLCQTSMVYVLIWGVLLLGERLSLTGIAGILLVLLGTYAVQLRQLTLAGLVRPFRYLGSGPVQAALGAGFVYSWGSVAEKTGVRHYSPLYFTYLLVVIMLGLMSVNLLRARYRPQIFAELRENWRLILVSGPVMMASFLTFRYGLSMAPMSYAVPTRQVSLLFGVLFGVFFLKESCGRIRFGAVLLILVGVVLVRLG